jgi:hypothetical protein
MYIFVQACKLILFKSFKKRYPVDSYQRVHNMLVKSCKSMGKLRLNSKTTGVARGAGTAYPSGAIECIPVFSGFMLFNLKSSMSICIWLLNYQFLILSVHFPIPASDYPFRIIKLAIYCWARTTWLSNPPVDLVQSRYIIWSKSTCNMFSPWNIWKRCSLVIKTTLMLWVRISIRARFTTLCGKGCQRLATDQCFFPWPPRYSRNTVELGVKHHQINK